MTDNTNNTENTIEESKEVAEPTIEDKAREKGWKPLEEFEGEESDWIDAQEFIAREPLYKALHSVKRENKKLKEMLGEVKKMFDNVKETSKQQAMKELKAQFDAAAAEGRLAEAIEARDQMKALETEPTTQNNPSTNVYEEWISENNWFESDSVLRRYANGVGQEVALQLAKDKYDGNINNLTETDLRSIYKEVTTQVKEAFPDKFQPRKKASTVNETTRRTSTKTSKEKTYTINDLPDDARQVAARLIRGKYFTEEKYLEHYRSGGGKFKGEE